MISHEEVVPYLLRQGLVEATAVVDRGVQVVAEARRNQNHHVYVEGGRSLLLKQGVRPGDDAGTVAREAAVLEVLGSLPEATQLQDRLPAVAGYDRERCILALDLIGEAENLRERQVRLGRTSVRIARAIGDTLGLLHNLHGAAIDHPALRTLSLAPPDVFELTCPPIDVLHGTSAAAHVYLALVQGVSGLAEPLDALASGWRRTALIHGDPRWDNWLVVDAEGTARSRVMLVDWEYATLGDPAWDVGSALGEYLGAWVLSIPALPGATLDRALHLSRFPLERLQPAMRALWRGYVRRSELSDVQAELRLAVRFAAAKLVQLGCEQMHRAANMTPVAGTLLQLAANILADTDGAADSLLGLTPATVSDLGRNERVGSV